jgi:PAS domain S-box-containing protein
MRQGVVVQGLRNSARRLALSGLALGLVTLFSYKLHINSLTVVLMYLLIAVLQSLGGGLISSAIVSVVAAACLAYFFFPPIFSFRVGDPLNVVALITFLIVTQVVTRLVSMAHGARRDAERRLALAEGAARLGGWDCDLQSKALTVSGEYTKLYGLTTDNPPLTSDQWLDLVHPDDRDRVRALLRESVQRTHVWDAEFRVVWPDGTVHWLLGRGTVFVDNSGRPSRISGVNLDVTDRKRAEEQRLRLADIVESCEDAIFSKNLDGTILSWNSGAEKLFGYTAEEIIGRPISQLLPPEHADELPQILERMRSGAHLEHYEVTRMRKDGRRVEVSVTISPVKDSEGMLVGSSTIARDITERRQADAALRESQERYKEVFDITSECIFLVDVTADGRFKFADFNPAQEKAVGFSSAEVSGRFIEEVVDEQVANHVIAHYRHCLEVGALISYEEELALPIGRRYFQTNLIPVRNAEGRIHRIVGIARDVTGSRESDEALRMSQQRLELAQEAGGIAVWDWDVGANQTRCSKEYGRLYGLPAGDLAPPLEEWLQLIHPEDRARVHEELNRALDGAGHYDTEFRVVWPDGTIHWLFGKGEVFRDSNGKPIRMLGVNMDITERKYADQALRESEGRFRNMANTAPVMIWVSDRDKLCSFFNAAWLAFTGRTMEQEFGNGWADGVHPADRDRCIAYYSSSFDARRNFQLEYRLRRADGQYRWILDSGVPRFEPGGGFAGYIGSCVDITDLRRSQEETLARQKLESVGVLAGGIAHDFNNLLGGILAEAELAATQLGEGESPIDAIQRISKVARRGAEIVRQLMIYSGQDKADPIEAFDLSRLVEEMLELLKVSISKHAALKTDLRRDLPAVRGRASQIRQIVMNLIINASEAIGEKGGVINVTTSRIVLPGNSGPDNPTHLPAGDYVNLEVSDTGGGMTEEVQAKVFDPFFTTKFAGRGLGLAVVQGIVRDQGGAINLVSAPGQGTTFGILLPCFGETSQLRRGDNTPASGKEHRARSGTVLIVEDEGILRLAVSRVLQKKGFCVIEAIDGSSALELVRAHKDEIDVMLLDITLPGVSSKDVFEEARHMRPDLKVILTSAYSRETVNATFAGLAIEGFIRKPFQMVDLIGLLEEALSA